jgi:hypothetical protein
MREPTNLEMILMIVGAAVVIYPLLWIAMAIF